MTASEDDPTLRLLAVLDLAIERLAADVAGSFAAAGIPTVLLKGPVLARWLYPQETRPYGDADLMVSPADWDAAVAVLARLGFVDALGPMAHPRMESFSSTAFARGNDNVDLHCTLHGLGAPPAQVWAAFSAGDAELVVADASLRVPPLPALALHVALHAAHHAEGKALEDLRRAIALAEIPVWESAYESARDLDGVPTFASGLRLVPEGAELAGRLGIPAGARSVAHEIRFEDVPTAEGIDALLRPGLGTRERLRQIGGELWPRPEFMRWWSPLARRGRLGLAISYPWRWLLLARRAPRGLVTVLRARRRRR